MKRKRHINKEIEATIQYAEMRGWRYKKAGNSAHAEQIRRRVKQCPHTSEEE